MCWILRKVSWDMRGGDCGPVVPRPVQWSAQASSLEQPNMLMCAIVLGLPACISRSSTACGRAEVDG